MAKPSLRSIALLLPEGRSRAHPEVPKVAGAVLSTARNGLCPLARNAQQSNLRSVRGRSPSLRSIHHVGIAHPRRGPPGTCFYYVKTGLSILGKPILLTCIQVSRLTLSGPLRGPEEGFAQYAYSHHIMRFALW